MSITLGHEHGDLGKSFLDEVSGFLQRQNRRQARDRSDQRRELVEGRFCYDRAQRGTAVIKARGLSSAGSAANAVVDTVVSLTNDTPANDWHSVAVCSDGSYGVEQGLICSFPVRCAAENGNHARPSNQRFQPGEIDASVAELKEEKSLVRDLIS